MDHEQGRDQDRDQEPRPPAAPPPPPRLRRREERKDDGRYLLYYEFAPQEEYPPCPS